MAGVRAVRRRRWSAAPPTSSASTNTASPAATTSATRREPRAATSTAASASTRWARPSTAWPLHGGIVRPYGATFLQFADYMRGAIRLSALMDLPRRVGLHARLGRARRGRPDAPAGRAPRGAARDPGPDRDPPGRRRRDRRGLARDRSRSSTGPAARALSRQNLPVLDRSATRRADGRSARGAYVAAPTPTTRAR